MKRFYFMALIEPVWLGMVTTVFDYAHPSIVLYALLFSILSILREVVRVSINSRVALKQESLQDQINPNSKGLDLEYTPRLAHLKRMTIQRIFIQMQDYPCSSWLEWLLACHLKCAKKNTNLTEIPLPYHSLIGKPGDDLNFPETVVYSNDAIRPAYLITYAKTTVWFLFFAFLCLPLVPYYSPDIHNQFLLTCTPHQENSNFLNIFLMYLIRS